MLLQYSAKYCITDVNECTDHNGGCSDTCTDNVGGFNCSCNDGFKLMKDKKGCKACPTGTWGKDCLRDCNCRDSDTACNETTGCAECPGGFTGGDCHEDIDECTVNDPCDGHSTCSNTIGTFKCVCHAGYTQYNATVCQGKQHVITTLYNSYVMDATLVLFVCVLCPRLDCFNSNALNRPRLPS
ncbi:hypothetical protein NP493_751g01036 [Ridgeia piscesae]|uniref:EGF-like domain-containing protein n=1 Tax=Ridgeia piscesae TaxID=27915 RepID=A0AAD9NM50_RIDPI|nr:hypothetical protein NP493_751g01036 [Ridgeia piscesae]